VELSCDVLIVGAGCGGVAGAIAAARLGRTVVLTEPTSWVGGQLTTQAVPPDEHPWVEDTGITRSYRLMRQAVRDRYRAEPQLTQRARRDPWLNPGMLGLVASVPTQRSSTRYCASSYDPGL
jgi:glycine/D-amino acid oxidase-like deaminating enzyme